jgi:hypothetical protein
MTNEQNQQVMLSWDDMMSRFLLMRPFVSKCRVQVKKLLSDLGYEENEDTKKAGTNGHWSVVPHEIVQEINRREIAFRESVKQFALAFPLIPGAHCVAMSRVEEARAKAKEAETYFFEIIDYMIENWDRLRAEQNEHIKNMLRETMKPGYQMTNTLVRIEENAPHPEKIRAKYELYVSEMAITTPKSNDVAEAYASEQKDVANMLRDMMKQLREPLTEKVTTIVELIKKGTKRSFNSKSINAALEDCRKLRQKNVLGDVFVDQKITQLESLLNQLKMGDVHEDSADQLPEFEKLRKELTGEDFEDSFNELTSKIGRRKI